MSRGKHILLRQYINGIPLGYKVWTLTEWEPQRIRLTEKYGEEEVEKRFIVERGGRDRLELLMRTLTRLEKA